MCSSRKDPYPPQGRLSENPRGGGGGGGGLKNQNFRSKARTTSTGISWGKGVGRSENKQPSMGGVWMFSGTAQIWTRQVCHPDRVATQLYS